MAILIDPPEWPGHGTVWSHLVSDADYAELHVFARRLGVPRRGFDLDHYDVPVSLHERAVALGALPVTAKELLKRLRASGLRVRQAERGTVTAIRRRQYLDAEWLLLGEMLGIGADGIGGAADRWRGIGEALLARWNEPHRHYHDERHLEDVLLSLDQLAVRGERVGVETLLAAWFHDAVYEGSTGVDAGADERASARLATDTLLGLGLDPALAHLVGELIVDTTPAREPRQDGASLALLLDADLSIFASSPERYAEYAAAVRQEYAHVPDVDFAPARARILAAYLAQPAIYHSETARKLWEERAHANLASEFAILAPAAQIAAERGGDAAGLARRYAGIPRRDEGVQHVRDQYAPGQHRRPLR